MRCFYGMAAMVVLLAPAHAQYGGPALLTRGQAPTAMAATQIDFRPFVSLETGYDSGINGVSVDPNGNPTSVSSVPVTLSGGISGLHSWRHTLVGLDYRLSFRHYGNQSFYDGSDQTLLLGVTHMITRHVTLSLRESAGMSSQNYNQPILQQTIPFDPGTSYLPTSDFFDNRTVYFSSQADLRIQKSTRLSYNLGVDGFLTRRRSTALYGNKGIGARGDVQYRVSRRSTIGAAYAYTHYAFNGIVSSTDIHSWNGTYAIAISRTLELGAYGGVNFYETKFQRAVPLDPVVAAVVCEPGRPCVATQLFYGRSFSPNITGRLSKAIPRGVLFLTAGHSIIPGNGLFLTSTSTNVTGGYSYTGLKRWSMNFSGNYTTSDSVGNILGQYGGEAFNAQISRHLIHSTHFLAGISARHYQSGDFKNYNRWSYSINAGFGWTPGDIPIRLW